MELATTVSVSSDELRGRTVHRQLAMSEALRQLGFEAGQVCVSWAGKPNTVLQVGDRTFTISYPESMHSADESEWLEEWLREANRWKNEMTTVDRERIFRRYVSSDVLDLLTIALKARGFRVLRSEN